jgi:hypothetical protein
MPESVEQIFPQTFVDREVLKNSSSTLIGNTVYYNTFAGTDITAQILVPFEEKPLVLGELQTISYSIHRENKPVRCLGHVNPSGFVKGPRTIAGSLIFTVFDSYAFYRLRQYQDLVYTGAQPNQYSIFPLADMLPPFDILITFANEYGRFARMKIFGVTIVDEGGTMSIEDLVTEQTYTYVARGIQPITAYIPGDLEQPFLNTTDNVTANTRNNIKLNQFF